jgi:hypothetical protein
MRQARHGVAWQKSGKTSAIHRFVRSAELDFAMLAHKYPHDKNHRSCINRQPARTDGSPSHRFGFLSNDKKMLF